MQNLFFLGIILVGKEKIQNKKTQKQYKNKKKIKASHFAVETVGTSMEAGTAGLRGRGQRDLKAPCRVTTGKNHKRKRKRAGWGPNCSLRSKRKGVQVFSAVENSEKQKEHMRSPQAPQTISAKCAQEPQRF